MDPELAETVVRMLQRPILLEIILTTTTVMTAIEISQHLSLNAVKKTTMVVGMPPH